VVGTGLVVVREEATMGVMVKEVMVREGMVKQATAPVAIQIIMEVEVMGPAAKAAMVQVAKAAMVQAAKVLAMEQDLVGGQLQLVERLIPRMEVLQGAGATTQDTRSCKGAGLITWPTKNLIFSFSSCLL